MDYVAGEFGANIDKGKTTPEEGRARTREKRKLSEGRSSFDLLDDSSSHSLTANSRKLIRCHSCRPT